jgi:hypothetical protein
MNPLPRPFDVWRLLAIALLASIVVACGGGGGGGTENKAVQGTLVSTPSSFIANQVNAVQLTVDNGPASFTGYNVNRLFTTVTICKPGAPTLCQAIDHVLVDTGSTGLRLLHSALAPSLAQNLGTVNAPAGQALLNCVQFVDNSHAFGKVTLADVTLGPKTAANLPIQIIADPAYSALSSVCASGQAITTVNDLGANGILGVGLYQEDCGTHCITTANNGYYFTCPPSGACASAIGTTTTLAQQIANPVPKFTADNNGVIIDLPAVPTTGTIRTTGQMVFGIDTQPNNASGSRTPLVTTAQGYIRTTLPTTTMVTSFIDSGSNGLFFGTTNLPSCGSSAPGFYCPNSSTSFSTTLTGTNAASAFVQVLVDNALTLFAPRNSVSYAVLPTLAGPLDNTSFDWGLPFFYGRQVFIGIEGAAPSSLGAGPLYAF